MKKKSVIAVLALALAMSILAAVFLLTRPQVQDGSKSITLVVVHKDGSEKTFPLKTQQAYLDKALQAENIIEGYDDQYGFVVEKVDGEAASWTENVFWCLYIDEQMATVGISQVPVEDGRVYKLVYESFN